MPGATPVTPSADTGGPIQGPGRGGSAATAAPLVSRYHVPGERPRRRAVNPIRRTQLAHRYPHTLPELLDLLSMYPEEAADPVSLEQLAALEPGRSVAQLLRVRHPAIVPGPPAERAQAPVFWRRAVRVELLEDPEGVPF